MASWPIRLGLLRRRSLSGRIVILVLLVVFATVLSSAVQVTRVRALQASVELLTDVYVGFNADLTRARVQAARVHEQVRRHAAGDPLASPHELRNFEEALEARNQGIRAARDRIAGALTGAEAATRQDDRVRLGALQSELDRLLAIASSESPEEALQDVRGQNQVEQGFRELERTSAAHVAELRHDAAETRRDTEQWTLMGTFAVVVLGALAAVGVFVTLHPLRRLADAVRRFGEDRDSTAPLPVDGDDEVSRVAREFNGMAEALNERERRLLAAERLAAAGKLAAQIAHEIRNPLSSVGLNAELLSDELADAGPEAKRLLERIAGEVDRLTQVTEDYLGLAGPRPPTRVRLDVGELMRDLLEFLAEEHGRAGVRVEASIPDAPVEVEGDAGALRQAFINLLRNAQEAALDAHAEGQPALRVELACKDRQVEVVVADNGPGIDLGEEPLERIFDAFFTRKARGTGLGLPIVHRIVAEHGGVVEVAQTGATGTRMRVTMPACDPQDPSVSSQRSAAEQTAS